VQVWVVSSSPFSSCSEVVVKVVIQFVIKVVIQFVVKVVIKFVVLQVGWYLQLPISAQVSSSRLAGNSSLHISVQLAQLLLVLARHLLHVLRPPPCLIENQRPQQY
jgi:hypothetical protein